VRKVGNINILKELHKVTCSKQGGRSVEVSGGSGKIDSVAIIRQDPQTHNWGSGNRYVKLWHKEVDGGKLIIQAPAVPGLTVPGYYMLFAISEEGVPSVAKLVQLQQWWPIPKEGGAWLDHHK
jgi:galactose oxidase